MATNIIPIQPSLIIRASSNNNNRKSSEPQRKSWWTPLFGWSSDPDYIDPTNNDQTNNNKTRDLTVSCSDTEQKTVRSRVSSANFTDEKARKLRMLTMETESFHDAMYHSAIASRLASDFSDRSDW